MSITDELRDWFKDRMFMANGWQEIHDIADRIDAEHEAMLVDARKTVYQGHIELPKDADGEYIHVGDVMELVSYDEDYRPVIRTVDAVGEQVFFAWSKVNGRYAQYEACAYRHHHAPTVEDVLTEFALACEDAGNAGPEVARIAAEYAKRLTLAEWEDA